MNKMYLRTLLLISFCATQADMCVVGLIGKAVILSCFYNEPENLASTNFMFEWRREDQLLYTANWTEGRETSHNIFVDGQIRVLALAQTGNFTMELSHISHSDAKNYSLHISIDSGTYDLICTICLKVAAHFTPPVLRREQWMEGARFICQSWGGFPEPSVLWDINHFHLPPDDLVTTHVKRDPHSQLYNITSILYTDIVSDFTVTCSIKNHLLDETLTTAINGVARTYKFIWTLGLALCLLVTVLVTLSLCCQRKLGKDIRLREEDSDCEETEMAEMDMEV